MPDPLPSRPEPFFLPTPNGERFCVYHRPTGAVRGHVLCVQPFNEELNRCRSMVTLQAIEWARLGVGTLVIDLHGTGDSSGEYLDARWPIWLDDLARAAEWLAGQPGPVLALLGIRMGALLAVEALAGGVASGAALIAWQPVLDGKLHLTQFFRVRIAAALDRTDLPKETTASIRKELSAGNSVEIAGYALHPELVAAIEQRSLARLRPPPGTRTFWIEHGGDEPLAASPASVAVIEAWRADGRTVELELFDGPMFWQIHDRVVTPAAIAASTRCVASMTTGEVPA